MHNAKGPSIQPKREAVSLSKVAWRQPGKCSVEKGELAGSALEAKVTLSAGDEFYRKLLAENQGILRYLFIVSKVDVVDGIKPVAANECGLPISIEIGKAPGAKCERCWNYSVEVGKHSAHPTLCERCVENI